MSEVTTFHRQRAHPTTVRTRRSRVSFSCLICAVIGIGATATPQAQVTVDDCRRVGEAFVGWALAQEARTSISKGASPQTDVVEVDDYPIELTYSEVESLLGPEAKGIIPRIDAWGHPYEYHFSGRLRGRVFLMRSPGPNGLFDTRIYSRHARPGRAGSDDIVHADGELVQRPF